MDWPEVNWDICQICDPCEARQVCQTRAIVKMGADEPAYIEHSRCNRCGKCVLACPFAAIQFNGVVP
jgi:Fe-S-cluster-containing hydrogenase component 2